ncbi:hypothetical protein Ntsu_60220 [Nocardia sp. IFM 10818]
MAATTSATDKPDTASIQRCARESRGAALCPVDTIGTSPTNSTNSIATLLPVAKPGKE